MAGYAVVAETEGGDLVQLYQSKDRRAAKAAATALRNAEIAVRVLPSDRLKGLVVESNPHSVRRR